MASASGGESLVREHPINCPWCGFANSLAARFCGGCGNALETLDAPALASLEAERRHLFVLFCDLVGSTPLSQRLDPEELWDVERAYERVCETVVIRNDGFVWQRRGDGILVLFGYPRAHEDDAPRVARCALEMLEAVRQLAIEIKVDLQVHVGIHSGRVVVGPSGAVGDTPNIAARITEAAGPSEVVVSDSVRRLLRGTFALEPMGIRKLKGVEQPLELFKVAASGGQPADLNAPQTPFIGRAGERERIREAWAHAKSGAPQFVLLRGEAGIGKSRLLDVVRREIADGRTDVLRARCTPVTQATALYPVIELIGLRLGFEGTPAEERVARIAKRMTELGIAPEDAVPLLSSVLSVPADPAVWPAPDLSPARARQRTMDILIEAIQALARRGPVLLIVEDLHWADPSTVDLLRQLMASPQRASLMALITARQGFKPTWAAAMNVTAIDLGGLDSTEAETFIRRVSSDKPLPPNVLWQILERAAGNPLYLEEITRSVTESGALIEQEHSWELVGTLSSGVVPASMEASLMARIERLGEARSLFQLGATLGREFSHDLLMAVAQLPDDTVQRQLNLMLDSGLIYRHGGPLVYSFKHALVRDHAYENLLLSTRQRYHARIAEVLVARFPEVAQNRPELLAHHLSGAGVYAEAATHWQAAGETAAKRGAVKEAVAHLRRALADLKELPDDAIRTDPELSVLTALAPVLSTVYGWAAPEVGDTCKRAIDLARRLAANDRMYRPLRGLWAHQFVGGRLHDAMETANQVLAMGLDMGDPKLVTMGRDATCYTRYYRGEYEEAIAEAQLGLRHCSFDMDVQIARSFQISPVSSMLITKASALWMQGRQDDGIAIVNDMVVHARSLRHPPSIAIALATAMFFSLYDRDWRRVFAFADEVYDLSRAEGFVMWTANAGLHRGRARIGLGEVDAGVAEVLEWGALFRQTGSGVIEGSTTSMLSEALHMAGRSEEALLVSAEGERRAETSLVRVMMPEIFRTRGSILLDLERADEADQAYHQAVACARAQGARSLELRALTSLLDLHLARGQPGNLPAELRRTMEAMVCRPDRPDLVTARELLAGMATEPHIARGDTCLRASSRPTP
jgi:class 3 adenylate cyclase/tetratricopeptide (TPR) repeat protein